VTSQMPVWGPVPPQQNIRSPVLIDCNRPRLNSRLVQLTGVRRQLRSHIRASMLLRHPYHGTS
jgi:hypothetical protein